MGRRPAAHRKQAEKSAPGGRPEARQAQDTKDATAKRPAMPRAFRRRALRARAASSGYHAHLMYPSGNLFQARARRATAWQAVAGRRTAALA